jgi:hypothetical protein
MHFPKYWIRRTARDGGVEANAFGWSDLSQEEAAEKAVENAKKIIHRIAAGDKPSHYGYHVKDRFKEEVIERFESEDGEEAVISRNRYGALILNTAKTMFVDIDVDENLLDVGLMASLKRFFGGRPSSANKWLEKKRPEIEKTLGECNLSAVMYLTHGGIRLLILNRTFDPTSDETRDILQRLDTDPLYLQLTRNQKCFRARLTPKPWRMGIEQPPADYPPQNPREEQEFQTWLNQYVMTSKSYGICACLGEMGIQSEIHPQAAVIRQIHDPYCLKDNLPLA